MNKYKTATFSLPCSEKHDNNVSNNINRNNSPKQLPDAGSKKINLLNVTFIDPDTGQSTFKTSHKCPRSLNGQHNEDRPHLWPQVVAAVAYSFVHFGAGIVGGFSGIVLPELTNPNSTDIYLTTGESALFSSITFLGLVIGTAIVGFILTKLGQRITAILSLLIGICGWIVQTFAGNVILILTARFMLGIMCGACIAPCGTYVIEISHTSIRGQLLAMNDLFRQIGFTTIAVVGSVGLHWRFVGLICGMLTLVPPLIGIYILPNSPRWLATQGRKDDAVKSLTFFRRGSYNIDKELSDIFRQLDGCQKRIRITDQFKMFRNKKLLKTFIVLVIVMAAANFVGNIAMAAYTITIFNSADTGIDEYMSTMVSTSMRILGATTYILLIGKSRKKLLLIIPLSLTGISMISMGVYFYLQLYYSTQNIKWLPLASMSVCTYTTGIYIPVIILLSNELLPTAIRSLGNSLLFLDFSVSMFLVALSFPYLTDILGEHIVFWIYGINAAITILIVALFIPETRGKTLEEIEDLY